MPATISPPLQSQEQRVVLRRISWETYERLLADQVDASSPRFTYDQGELEIMSPSAAHEQLSWALAAVAEIAAEEWEVEFENAGSTTFRRRDLEQGLEPDSCFYLQNAERIRWKQEIDLQIDLPPDLVIEIEITSPAISKLPIYARLGVPEIWLYNGSVKILRLAGDRYEEARESSVLPPLSDDVLLQLVDQKKTLTTLAWRRVARDWARQHRQLRAPE
jgi:Uma2 family endonuclease